MPTTTDEDGGPVSGFVFRLSLLPPNDPNLPPSSPPRDDHYYASSLNDEPPSVKRQCGRNGEVNTYSSPSSSSRYPHHPPPPRHSPPNPFHVVASPFNLGPTPKRPRPDLPPPGSIQTPAPFLTTPTNSIYLPSSPTSPQPELLPFPHHNQPHSLPEFHPELFRAQRRNCFKHLRMSVFWGSMSRGAKKTLVT